MARRSSTSGPSALPRAAQRSPKALTKGTLRIAGEAARAAAKRLKAPRGPGDWLADVAIGAGGARRYRLYRPPDLQSGERLPLLVMLHGCRQTSRDFALSTRMNLLAAHKRFFVLYPEQDRLANAQGCWNWYDRRSGKADAEAATLMAAVDQACALYPVDRDRVAVAGLSAGASMAALLASVAEDCACAEPGTATAAPIGAISPRRRIRSPLPRAAATTVTGANPALRQHWR